MSFKSDYSKMYRKLMDKVPEALRKAYVIAFNCYAWWWLYRAIFIKENTTYEDYLLWGFTTTGMYFFVFDNKDRLLFKRKE